MYKRQLYPKVRVQLTVSNRRVDVINEGVDIAIRVRSKLDDDGSLVMRSFGQIQELLVASPQYLQRAGRPQLPEQLAEHVTLSVSEDDARQRWELHGPDGEAVSYTHLDVYKRQVRPCAIRPCARWSWQGGWGCYPETRRGRARAQGGSGCILGVSVGVLGLLDV